MPSGRSHEDCIKWCEQVANDAPDSGSTSQAGSDRPGQTSSTSKRKAAAAPTSAVRAKGKKVKRALTPDQGQPELPELDPPEYLSFVLPLSSSVLASVDLCLGFVEALPLEELASDLCSPQLLLHHLPNPPVPSPRPRKPRLRPQSSSQGKGKMTKTNRLPVRPLVGRSPARGAVRRPRLQSPTRSRQRPGARRRLGSGRQLPR